MRILMTTMLLIIAASITAAAQQFTWEHKEDSSRDKVRFDQEHHEEYIRGVLHEMTGKMPRPDATREELAQITLDLLNKLRTYGERQTAMIEPEIPFWFLRGYESLNPRCVSNSRYFDGVVEGTQLPQSDIAVLYSFWCVYDAEWFSVSRDAEYKAWLSAVMVKYPPLWDALRVSSEEELHDGLVVPLQTPDEPYREIDNWINAYWKNVDAFAKPKVRDALVSELLEAAGVDADERFYDEEAYADAKSSLPGLTDRQFFLGAALALEFSQEIYRIDPETKQLLHFRDFFVEVFDYHRKLEAE